MMKKLAILLLPILFLNLNLNAQIPEKPKKERLVNDFSDILNANEEAQLERKLVEFSKSTSTQITIVTVDDLKGYAPSQFAYEIGETWGVGQEGFNNGVVILVKPTGGQGERHTFIATGYGLEPVLPDAIAKRIVEKEMIPHFKNNDFYGGLDAATDIIMGLAAKEFTPQEYKEKSNQGSWAGIIVFLIVIGIIIFSRVFSARSYAHSNNLPFWTALMLMSSSRGHGGSYGSFSSGGGGFGGFGGFGGGSFGGGGAGGSW